MYEPRPQKLKPQGLDGAPHVSAGGGGGGGGAAVGGGVGAAVGAGVGAAVGEGFGVAVAAESGVADGLSDGEGRALAGGGAVSRTREDGEGLGTVAAAERDWPGAGLVPASAIPLMQEPRNKTEATTDATTVAPLRKATRTTSGVPRSTAQETTSSAPAMVPGASRLPWIQAGIAVTKTNRQRSRSKAETAPPIQLATRNFLPCKASRDLSRRIHWLPSHLQRPSAERADCH
jgi:hypothetical protein